MPTNARRMFDQAEAEFRKVLAAVSPTDPQSAATLNYLGYMNADRGVKLDESLNFIKQALTLEPNNGAYLDSLGWAYFKLGKYDLAEESLTKASIHMGTRRHRAGASRRPLPENRPPETSRRPLGSRRAGVEQNRPG